MQQDMHFTAVYYLARAAGLAPDAAKTIATASQFVDDAIDQTMAPLHDGRWYVPIMTAHVPLDYLNAVQTDQWNVWVPFHFLPGAKGDATGDEAIRCREGSALADAVLSFARDHRDAPWANHLAGIVAHAYMDSFSHHGFAGISTKSNLVVGSSVVFRPTSDWLRSYIKAKWRAFASRIVGTLAEVLPVGHGSVATLPDRPYLNWEFRYEDDKAVQTRDNPKDFFDGARGLFDFFLGLNGGGAATGEAISFPEQDVVGALGTEGTCSERATKWRELILDGSAFPPEPADLAVGYQPKEWRADGVVARYAQTGNLAACDGWLFMQAAARYRDHVVRRLLPQYDYTANPAV